MSYLKSNIVVLLLCCVSIAQAQFQTTTMPVNDDKVFLLPGSDSLIISRLPDGTEIRRIVNNVAFKHKGTLMYCDLAIHNVMTNIIQAYGKVRIVQGDTVTITGDTLLYNGNTRFSTVSGKTVVLKDRKRTLTTTHLNYDMATGIAYYPNRGKSIDDENTLTSKQGYYDTRTKIFTYYQEVKLVNKKYTLTTDTLIYSSLTKIADFRSLTKVVSKDGTLLAKNGSYNTQTGESVFKTRTTIDNPDYTLTGDAINFDNQTKLGYARGNVELLAKNDKTILNGDYGRYNGKAGISKVWGHALTRNISDNDTLYMTADTLYSIEIKPAAHIKPDTTLKDSLKKEIKKVVNKLKTNTQNDDEKSKPKKLVGIKNVMIYKKDLQSTCDSLIYNTADSTITFLQKPTIWSSRYQLEADSIVVQMERNRARRMYLKLKSFIIAQDSILNFNQVKGRYITAHFDDSTRLQKVFVEGNGESIYFAMDDSKKMMGMNRVECSKMTLNFKKNTVKKILFVGQPDGKFYPPKDIRSEQKSLEGFLWRVTQKPTREKILNKSNLKLTQLTTSKSEIKSAPIIEKTPIPANVKNKITPNKLPLKPKPAPTVVVTVENNSIPASVKNKIMPKLKSSIKR